MSKIGIALIGCGAWGKNHLRVWSEMGHLRVVCDTDPGRLESIMAQYPDVELYTDMDTILRRSDIQAVVIATPAPSHASLAIKAMKAGKDALVEKPMALTVNQGGQMVAMARQLGRILMVGYVLEYHPAIRQVHQLIDNGELGEVQYIYSGRLNPASARPAENTFSSHIPHDIELILRILGTTPDGIACQETKDTTNASLHFPNGQPQAHIFLSWRHPFSLHQFVVSGDRRSVLLDDARLWPEKLSIYSTHNPIDFHYIDLTEAEPLRVECGHFLQCIIDRQQPLTDGESGLQALRVLVAAQKSNKLRGQRITI